MTLHRCSDTGSVVDDSQKCAGMEGAMMDECAAKQQGGGEVRA